MRGPTVPRGEHRALQRAVVRGTLTALLVMVLVATPAGAHYVDVRKDMVRAGTLSVGVALTGRPFAWRQDGALHGFEIDVARGVAESNGLDIEFRAMARDQLLPALENGDVDVINTVTLPELPAELVQVPYLRDGDFIMVLRGNPFRVTSPQDLGGRTVAVTAGTSAARYAYALNDRLMESGREPMDIHSFAYQRDTAFPVNMGHAAAYFVQAVSAVGITRDEHARTRLVEWGFRPTREVGLGMRAEREVLHHAVEHALAAMVATGRYAALLENHGLPRVLSPYAGER